MAKPKPYKMWAVFNYDRPPIFVQLTRRECVIKATRWLGGEAAYRQARRNGAITIAKITVRPVSLPLERPGGST